MNKDYLVKAYAFDGTVRIYAASTTELVNEYQHVNESWPAATAAMGRAMTATVIMGAMYKEDQTLSIRIDGGGPIGKIIVTTNAKGDVRGFCSNPHVHISTNENKLAVGHVVGNNGFIHVTKDLKVRDIFTSSAQLQTGEIADDFTYYFAKSEQIPSSVGLGVLVGDDNKVLSSGGFILQAMPGCSKETISEIESNIQAMKPVSELIMNGYTPEMIIQEITKGNHEFVEHMSLQYACDCSKDRFARGIMSLDPDEILEMIGENKPIETVCHFCGKKYHFDVIELTSLYNTATKSRKKPA